MNVLPVEFLLIAQAASSEEVTRSIAWSLPEGPWEWSLFVGLSVVALIAIVAIYLRDTSTMHWFWKSWLMSLRIGVLVGLALIFLNPHIRTEMTSIRPSRVALFIDKSSSMRFPQHDPPENASPTAPASGPTRAEAVAALLTDSPLIEELRKHHEVSVYTFDSTLVGPQHVFYPKVGAADDKKGSETTESTAPDDALDWQALLQPEGLETRLGEALVKLIDQVSGKTLSGIVIFSDGGLNAGISASAAQKHAREKGTRLIAVGVGSTKPPVNLQVAGIQGPSDVHLGDAFELSAFVKAEGLTGETVEVEFLVKPADDPQAEPTQIAVEELQIAEDNVPVELRFQRTPSTAGKVEFLVRARPKRTIRESRLDDNQQSRTVNVIERNLCVLIIAGGPMRDYRFVRNMLARHPGIDVDVWLQSVDPDRFGQVSQDADDLLAEFPPEFPKRPLADQIPEGSKKPREYDVVIAFDADWVPGGGGNPIPPEGVEKLVRWVDELAGGLILVAGDVYTSELAEAGPEMQPVRNLYPVILTPYLFDFTDTSHSDQPWPVAFTRDGQNVEFLQLAETGTASQDPWKEFEGVYRCYPTDGAKAGATVYAEFGDPRTLTEHGRPILLASQFYGAGRTFYLGSPEVWRLRALSEEYYDRFWTKLIREAGLGRLKQGNSRAMLMPERSRYNIGETVVVRARLLGPQFEAVVQESLELEVTAPDGTRLVPPLSLQPVKDAPGQYMGTFRAALPGSYTLELPIPESRLVERAQIEVQVPQLELEDSQQKAGLLSDLVRDTGGRYLTLDQAVDEIPPLLPDKTQMFLVEDRPEELWDRNWVLYLLVGLLSVEWLTRKLLKLA